MKVLTILTVLVDEHPDADARHVKSVQEVLNVILQRVIILLVRLLHLDHTLHNQNIHYRYYQTNITPCTIKIYTAGTIKQISHPAIYCSLYNRNIFYDGSNSSYRR